MITSILNLMNLKELATVSKVTDVCHSRFQGNNKFICGDVS